MLQYATPVPKLSIQLYMIRFVSGHTCHAEIYRYHHVRTIHVCSGRIDNFLEIGGKLVRVHEGNVEAESWTYLKSDSRI